ncbi:DUF6541 family protein [Actinomyces sp.]|uniref:DUF6541 family protein n=1 Tax=Actinomyces sp. TaxID=29317 RepID=UPI0029063667|nr:DUF6541 family protein [Actinomyces sp.]MDU6679092.1 DUF6541 family protein [Actinomyces sp.]
MYWVLQLPILVAMLLVVALPGWMWLRVFSFRFADRRVGTLVQLATAPLLAFGLLAVLANLAPRFGVRWSAGFAVTTLMVVAVAGFVVDLIVRRGRRAVVAGTSPARWDWPLIGAIAGAVTIAALPLLVFANPRNPLQQWDPSFHYNGVWQMVHSGDGSLFGLSPMFSVMDEAHTYYPSMWHAFAALFATPSTVVQTVNTSSLALLVWWIVGMAALAHYLWDNRVATLTAPVLASLTLSFPADFVSMYAQWPNAVSMALLPGLLTLAWVVGNAWVRALFSSNQWRATTIWTALFLLAALGAVAIHPISFFNALVFVFVPLAAAMVRLMRGARKAGRRGLVAFLGVAMGGALLVTALAVFNPRTLATATFERGRSLIDALVRPFMPVPPFPLAPGFVLAMAVFAGLLVLGLMRARKLSKSRWLIGTWTVFAVLVFLAYAPNFGLQVLTGPWYSDPRRLMGAMQVVLVLLFTLGAMRFSTWLRQKKSMHRALPVLLIVVLSGVGAIDSRSLAVRSVYDPQNLGPAGMASSEQLDLFREAGSVLPGDALVLGDPSVGTVYFRSLGGMRVVFPGLSNADVDADVRALQWNFNQLHADPAVCETLNRIGVTHFYEGSDRPYYRTLRAKARPGFYGVDTSHGFEVVKSVDGGTLYELTACR